MTVTVKRVVVVEDTALIAQYIKWILEEKGTYSVNITESADEAVALASHPETVVAIVDVTLRGTQHQGRYIDGLQLGRMIKRGRATGHVAVIITSAHTRPEDQERFLLESGADGFLGKPIDPQSLRLLVDRFRR
jgi:CheY-like chemotaxis protein